MATTLQNTNFAAFTVTRNSNANPAAARALAAQSLNSPTSNSVSGPRDTSEVPDRSILFGRLADAESQAMQGMPSVTEMAKGAKSPKTAGRFGQDMKTSFDQLLASPGAKKLNADELIGRAMERTNAWAATYNNGNDAGSREARATQLKVEIAREYAVALGDKDSMKLAADVQMNAEGGRRLGAANDKSNRPEDRAAILANHTCYDQIETTLRYKDYVSPSSGISGTGPTY